MIRPYLTALSVVSTVSFAAAQSPQPAAPAEPDPAQVRTQSSYALGYRTGGMFAQHFGSLGVNASDLDTEVFLKGFLTALNNQPEEIPFETQQAAMAALGEIIQARETELAAANLERGKQFLAENTQRPGVITTASGLQYEVLREGTGKPHPAPAEGEPSKQFLVQFRGTFIDGKEFEATPAGQPAVLEPDHVFAGFREALALMPVGAKWKLFIPSHLAHGEKRLSADIPPNSTLIFDFELVGVQDAPAPSSGNFPIPIPLSK